MKRTDIMRAALAAVVSVVLAGEMAPPAAAQVPLANAGLGLFRVINAFNRRNRTYQTARDTQRDFNAYYNSLQDTARAQLISGELTSLRQGEGGLETVRMGAYVRLTAALEAEQAAITRAIDAETNQARRDFNGTLVRQLQEVVVQLPGAQQILGEVRTVIANVRATVIALQAAAASNQPLDVLTQRLAEQVSSSSIVQDRVRELGSMLGPDLDRALGGALTQVNNTIQDVNREANQAVELLDGMDAQVAALDLSQAEPAGGDTPVGPLNIRLTDRATATLDVASQALAFLTLMQSPGGTTREQLYQQIRTELLNQRNASLLNAAMHVSAVECREVGVGEYETVAAWLGEAVQTPAEGEQVKYYVCSERATGEPLSVWMGRVDLPLPESGGFQAEPIGGEEVAEPDAPPAQAEHLTLEQVDAAQYLSFSAAVTQTFSNPQESACYSDITLVNTHPSLRLLVTCETYDLIRERAPLDAHSFGMDPGEVNVYGGSWHMTDGALWHERYTVRCVAYTALSEEGTIQPGTQWIRDSYPDAYALLNSGLTAVVPPNPCAR